MIAVLFPEAGLIEAPALTVTSPALEVTRGVVVSLVTVVWANAWPAQTSAVRLTSVGPNRSERRRRPARRPCGRDKHSVMHKHPRRPADRSSTIVSAEWLRRRKWRPDGRKR